MIYDITKEQDYAGNTVLYKGMILQKYLTIPNNKKLPIFLLQLNHCNI